jgi:hypothetical protein
MNFKYFVAATDAANNAGNSWSEGFYPLFGHTPPVPSNLSDHRSEVNTQIGHTNPRARQ